MALVGFFAMQSRGDDGGKNNNVNAVEREPNCSPIARADAAATRPGELVLVDVLANDTDADGDTLVFQILNTEGGTSEIDDGDTPTDSSDDRLAFTPTDPPTGTASVEYQALDPEGGFSASTVTIAVNPEAMLPDGVRSALATDPAAEGTESSRCGEPEETTTTSVETTIVEDVTTTTAVAEEEQVDDSTDTTARRTTRTTAKKGTSTKRTTTTAKRTSGGSGGSTNTTRPSQSPPTTDNTPSVTAPEEGGGGESPSTTAKPQSDPPPDPECGSPKPGSPSYNPNYSKCKEDQIRGGTG